MTITVEILRDKLNGFTYIFVWNKMKLMEGTVYEYIMDEYEAEGIEEELKKKYKKVKK